MVDRLESVGLRFNRPVFSPFAPKPTGTAHKPWQHPPFNLPGEAALRNLKGSGIQEHPSIQERIDAGSVAAEPGEAPTLYKPSNRP